MSNHYHLLIQIQEGGLSSGMRELNGNFSRYRNLRQGHEWHLFRNRFWSALIEEEGHMLQTSRYIVLNPVRARLCDRPEKWEWSSYRAFAGLDFRPTFLSTALLRLFGGSPARAQRAYRAFVREGLPVP